MAKKPFTQGAALLTVALAVKAVLAQTPPERELEMAETPDVAAPGGLVVLDEAVVQGRRDVNIEQATTQVVSVLSGEDIARTGEGDIAAALAHVPGLSVVGGGFVYVRGLGDRYSLALLNGSPLPSPEPLRRAVPLNLFPTDVIASSLVQKTYSPNYGGEFGGGVINLTTLAIPKQPFLKFSAGTSADTETTGHLAYDYYGSKMDWTGYDNGSRDVPPALASFLSSGQRLSTLTTPVRGDIARQLVNWRTAVVQRLDEPPANYSGTLTGGTSWGFGDGSQLGLVATAGFDNKWRTRESFEQTPVGADLSAIRDDYRRVATDNHVVVNGLLGLGYEFGDANRLRWTSLYIHDTLKHTSLSEGKDRFDEITERSDHLVQSTGWYERELLSSQLAATVQLADPLTLDARASWSTSKRDAPYESDFSYTRSNLPATQDPYGAYFINRLGSNTKNQVAFANLDEDLKSAGLDLSWRLRPGMVLSAGYEYAYTAREAWRRAFRFDVPTDFPTVVAMFRPDYLIGSAIGTRVDLGTVTDPSALAMLRSLQIDLTEPGTKDVPAFAARLMTHGAYGQLQTQLVPGLELSVGARFERGKQVVRPIQTYDDVVGSTAPTRVENDYVLPAATLTWKLGDAGDKQLRFNVSRTIARPQFRELMYQLYVDPEANRAYRGNPLLEDSKFFNAEARFEWYYARDQQFSLAGFYKKIDKPIESYLGPGLEGTPEVSFANAPEAGLYGAELEWARHFPLDWLDPSGGGMLNGFLSQRRLVLVSNYTYTSSKLKVGPNDRTHVFGASETNPLANAYFTNGAPLTGQSDHIVNLQFGLENPAALSQLTLLLSYASDRVISRGGSGAPDVQEAPGVNLDFVARQGFTLFNQDVELKFEARNLLGRSYKEFQENASGTVYRQRYDVGTSFGLSVSMTF